MAVHNLADNGCSNLLIVGDFNSSLGWDIDYVEYQQGPHQASREFLFGLQNEGVFIDFYGFLYPYDLSYTWIIHNTKKKPRMHFAFTNQNLISGVTEMRHTWNQSTLSDHAMFSLSMDFETIERGRGIYKYPLELQLDVNYPNIIHSTIKQQVIE